MTAEIAILNQTAIALAADSAVTVRGSKGEKIFNTANKLFNLSKYHPVGLMIFNDANFMNIPWETIIKTYRSSIKNKLKNTIEEQVQDFIGYIKRNKDSFTNNKIIKYFVQFEIRNIFSVIKSNIENKIDSLAKDSKTINLSQLINEQLDFQKKWFSNYEYYNDFELNGYIDFFKMYKWDICRIKYEIYQKIPLTKENNIDLIKIIYDFIHRNHSFRQNKTGIVITGFGIEEYLPSLVDFEIKYFIGDKLLYKIINKRINVSQYSINPYGQPEMVYAFRNGINPKISEFSFTALSEMINKIAEDLNNIPQLNILDPINKNNLIENIKKLHQDNLKEFEKKFNELIIKNYLEPVTNSVESLPKEELAAVAESLVYLAFLRKRISDEPETVGGDIDVAVISKGDGFIWIKRKHYFKPELNPHFFKNYFK